MKTKIMAGIALTAIAATGVVGGFAIAHGGLNSAVNATNAKSIVFSATSNQYVAGATSYVAKTLATGSFSGDSGVSVTLYDMSSSTLTASDASYFFTYSASKDNATLMFQAGCTGLSSITANFTVTGTGASATVSFQTHTSMAGSSVENGTLTSGTTHTCTSSAANFVAINFSGVTAGTTIAVTSITLGWAC